MLENYFIKPSSVDNIRENWLGESIEQYVAWLIKQQYSRSSICRRIRRVLHFSDYCSNAGANTLAELPDHIDPFVEHWIATRKRKVRSKAKKRSVGAIVRVPIEQMVSLIVPHYRENSQPEKVFPFQQTAPGFSDYLSVERGLASSTTSVYTHHLRHFESYLATIELQELNFLSPAVLSAFIAHRSQHIGRSTLTTLCSTTRLFLRYLYRENLITSDLAATVDCPKIYRLSSIPRSITWDEVRQLLEAIEQRTITGKRDYAMLLLLATYGLRAREIAALTLDDIDWKRGRLQIPDRKAGHNTAFPLSSIVGEAIASYLQQARPDSTERAVFLSRRPPFKPVTHPIVSGRVACYLRQANIDVKRPGSHTLRHTCVKRLIDNHLPLKTIGDYIGHSSPRSTEIYTKIDLDGLREMALGEGELVV